MGLSLLSALAIQDNNTGVLAYQDVVSKKWGYEIMLVKGTEVDRQIVTCGAIYNSKRKAERKGKKLVRTVNELDLSSDKGKITSPLGDASSLVQQIIDATKGQ